MDARSGTHPSNSYRRWGNASPPPLEPPFRAADQGVSARLDTSTPVILLGGRENSVAVARNLGSLGIPIYASGRSGCRVLRSRHCLTGYPVPADVPTKEYWRELLLERLLPRLAGAVVIANCDESLAFLASHHDAVQRHYRVEEFRPELRMAMLDKLETLKLARAAGVPTPQFWEVPEGSDLTALLGEIRLPVMVKPLDTARFAEQFGRKLFIVEASLDEVAEKVEFCRELGHAVMVVEMIPGPDALLSSFNTYRTPTGRFLYCYTKQILRRWPVNRGGATFHQSRWFPETAELGQILFEGIDWQGVGNVEFKRDPRDGMLKIIEVNGRFTAAQRLITEAGAPIDEAVYRHLTGQEVLGFAAYKENLRMWYPLRDFLAFLALRARGELTLTEWLRSLGGQSIVLPYFSVLDPWPAIEDALANALKWVASPAALLRRMLHTWGH